MLIVRRMLTVADREEISRGLAELLAYNDIAARIDRDPSIVSRGVARHGGRDAYRATNAQNRATTGRARPKPRVVDARPGLRTVVISPLRQGWSPASIAGRLPTEYPDQHAWRVSHEAIYQWVYAQPVASLRRELIALRAGRTHRAEQDVADGVGVVVGVAAAQVVGGDLLVHRVGLDVFVVEQGRGPAGAGRCRSGDWVATRSSRTPPGVPAAPVSTVGAA
jgi:hypothetical protein